MKQKIIKIILIAVITILIEIILSPIRGYAKIGLNSCVGFVVFFIMFLFFKKKHGHILSLEQILFSMVIGYLLLDSPFRYRHFEHSLISLPDVIMHLIGIFCSYITCRFLINKKTKYIPFIIGMSICLFMYFEGYAMYRHKLNFGTYIGTCKVECPLPLTFETLEGKEFILNEKEGYVLLYYWNEYCGVCINSFPKLQKMYEEKPEHIQIFAAYLGKDLKSRQRVSDLVSPYSFPVLLSTVSTTPFLIDGFPTVLLIDMKNEKIIFQGNLKYAKETIQKL